MTDNSYCIERKENNKSFFKENLTRMFFFARLVHACTDCILYYFVDTSIHDFTVITKLIKSTGWLYVNAL